MNKYMSDSTRGTAIPSPTRPPALGGVGQESVSKATIPACMTLGDMHMAWGRMEDGPVFFLPPPTDLQPDHLHTRAH